MPPILPTLASRSSDTDIGALHESGRNDGQRRTPLNRLICRLFSRHLTPFRMVEPIVPSTFGPRVGYGMLSIKTPRRVRLQVLGAPARSTSSLRGIRWGGLAAPHR